MSREEVERLKLEEEKLGLRRSQRHRNRETDTENSNTEVDLESGERDSWDIDGLTVNDRVGVESEESVAGESVYSFGEFSNTAHYNHKFEEEQKTSTTSFKGVIEKGKMSKSTKAGSVDSGVGAPQEAGLAELMRALISNQERRDERRDQERRDEQARRDEERKAEQARRDEERKAEQKKREEERRVEKEDRERERAEAKEREKKLFDSMNKKPDAPRPQVTLPKLNEEGDVESFLVAFETALGLANIPETEWKARLVSNIPMESLVRISSSVEVEVVGYYEVKDALRGISEVQKTGQQARGALYTRRV